MEIGNIDGTLGKAGLTRIRFFVFNKEADVRSTVEFGQTAFFGASSTEVDAKYGGPWPQPPPQWRRSTRLLTSRL
jgi:hypothetical protein